MAGPNIFFIRTHRYEAMTQARAGRGSPEAYAGFVLVFPWMQYGTRRRAVLVVPIRHKSPPQMAAPCGFAGHRAGTFCQILSTLSCSPVQAAGIEIPCLFFKLFSMAALSRAGVTIMKRRLIML